MFFVYSRSVFGFPTDTLPAGVEEKKPRTEQMQAAATQSSRKFVISFLYIVLFITQGFY